MTLPELLRRSIWLAVVAAFGGCSHETPPPINLPLPSWANERVISGNQGNIFYNIALDMETQLSPMYTIPDHFLWRSAAIDSSVAWPAIESFYSDAFTHPPLAGSGFVRRDIASEDPSSYEFALWSRPGERVGFRPGKDEVLIVLYVRPLNGSRIGVLSLPHRVDEVSADAEAR